MVDRFNNAPLVELVAEVRWGTGGVIGQLPQPFPGPNSPVFAGSGPQVANPLMVAAGQYEDFFMQFASKVGTFGYGLIERLVPRGFPHLPYQAIYRFRRGNPQPGTMLYQVGAGVFSANITPPYHSWAQFRPVVEQGIKLLIETRNPTEQATPFSFANLRYINAFDEAFTGGRSFSDFIQNILGFKVTFPAPLVAEASAVGDIKPYMQLQTPLKNQQQMSITLADGVVSGKQAIVMDISVANDKQISPTSAAVMASFDKAHEVIHNLFVGITVPLFEIMKPVEGDTP